MLVIHSFSQNLAILKMKRCKMQVSIDSFGSLKTLISCPSISSPQSYAASFAFSNYSFSLTISITIPNKESNSFIVLSESIAQNNFEGMIDSDSLFDLFSLFFFLAVLVPSTPVTTFFSVKIEKQRSKESITHFVPSFVHSIFVMKQLIRSVNSFRF